MPRSFQFLRPSLALTAAILSFASAPLALAQNAAKAPTSGQISSSKQGLKVGSIAFVTSDKLNLRLKASLSADVVIGALGKNDQVQIVSLLDNSSSLVQIKVLRSNTYSGNESPLFVSADFLSPAAVATTRSSNNSSGNTSQAEGSKYFAIQNVATERMRVYERCTSGPGCSHRLVFETEMVVGRPEGKNGDRLAFVTWLGRYKITEWVKFYQDGLKHYPSWYDPNYPAPPKPGSGGGAWMSKKHMPDKEGDMRGAFGWYAAMVAPNANYQWIHGTIGWGSDADKFIKMTRDPLLNIVANPRSAGCTRLENRAVAYSRHILPVGTEIFRVYAQEAYRDQSRAAYQNQASGKVWEFILTKEGVRKSGAATSDKNSVLARNIEPSLILEQGSYNVDMYPNGIALNKDAGWMSRIKGKSGNSYDIDPSQFRGVFLIDEGKFVNYSHPAGLPVGGFPDRSVPAAMQTSGDYTIVTKLNQ